MPEVNNKYSEQKVHDLKRFLQREIEKGRAKDYEIQIDGFKVVTRTDDLSEFDEFAGEISDDTGTLSILVFDGKGTNRNTRYNYHVNAQELSSTPLNGFGGLGEVGQRVKQLMKEQENEKAIVELNEQVASLQDDVDDRQKLIDKLEKEIESLRQLADENKYHLGGVSVTELATETIKLYISGKKFTNPKVAQFAGLLGALGGIGAPMPTGGGNQPGQEQDAQATFSEAQPAAAWSRAQEQFMGLATALEGKFSPQEVECIHQMVAVILHYPEKLPQAAQLLNVKI